MDLLLELLTLEKDLLMLSVVEDKCELDNQGNSCIMVLESDFEVPQDAIGELNHADARHMACREASRMFGIPSPGTSGMSMHPYAINSAGVAFDEFKESEEVPSFEVSRYRISIPVTRGWR